MLKFYLKNQKHFLSKDYQHFSQLENLSDIVDITYVYQSEQLGLGHAVMCASSVVGDEPFAVILADDLCDCDENGVISQMIEIYNQYQFSVVAIQEIPIHQTNKYGIIAGNLVDNSNNI